MTTQQELESLGVIKDSTLYTSLVSVSRSGMQRRIKVLTITDNRIINISRLVGEIIKCGKFDPKTNSIKINGVGMDMGFAIVYNLSFHMFDGEMERGYRLRHEWI